MRTAASVNTFPGFITLYSEGKDEAEDEGKITLPQLAKGDELKLAGSFPGAAFYPAAAPLHRGHAGQDAGAERHRAAQHLCADDFHHPGPRVCHQGQGVFQPTELGFAVNDLLVQDFPDIINVKFTADMENELDDIASNEREWPSVIQDFYTPFEKDLQKAVQTTEKVKLPDEPTGEACPKCGKPLVVKTGRFGKFVACSGYPECKYTQSFQVKMGAKCPQCGKELIQRMSKKKRTFYGCSGYPNCKFVTNFKPFPSPARSVRDC